MPTSPVRASATASVDYATNDSTAWAGEDYTATSGTLTFEAGETEKTISVPVLNDVHDDGGETLTLSSPFGARLATGGFEGDVSDSGEDRVATDGACPPAWSGWTPSGTVRSLASCSRTA